MSIIENLLILTIGFIVAVPSSIVGLGGGFFIVPVLILFFQLPAKNAIAVSLVAICGTTLSSTIGYVKQGRIDYKLGLLYDILDIPGIAIGAYITTLMPQNFLAGTCGVFIVFVSVLLMRKKGTSLRENLGTNETNMAWRGKIIDSSGQAIGYTIRRPYLALLSSFLGGFISGLSGLGGGITDVSTMILLGVPPHIAVASSEFAMAVTNGAGVIAHGLLNNILFEYAIPITMGTVTGAQIGCLLSKRVKGNILRKTLSLIAIFAGARLIYLFFIP